MFTNYSTALRKVLLKSRACFVRRSGGDADRVQLLRKWEERRGHMGKRSDRRKFRRRRRWAAFFLLISIALMVFGVMSLTGSPDKQPVASGGIEKAAIERAAAVRLAGAGRGDRAFAELERVRAGPWRRRTLGEGPVAVGHGPHYAASKISAHLPHRCRIGGGAERNANI